MDLRLSVDQQAIVDAARTFVAREVAPHAATWDRNEELDRGIVAKLADAGLLGCAIPEAFGGMGVSNVDYCLIVEELGRGCSSVRSLITVNLGLVGKSLMKWGTPAQRQAWLPQLASGSALGCFGLTEAGSGSDPASLVTSARRDGDDYLISGAKMFVSNGGWAGLALIFARTGGAGAKGLSCFLVPTASAGYSTRPINGKLGLRAADTAAVYLDDVRVPQHACLGGIGNGMKVAMSALDSGRMGLAAGCVGLAQAALDLSMQYAAERTQFGRPIARFQLVQELLADMAVEIDCCAAADVASRLTRRRRQFRSPPRRHMRNTTPAKPPCAPPMPRCRFTAATATSTNTQSDASCATRE